jgi:hypothetical protein
VTLLTRAAVLVLAPLVLAGCGSQSSGEAKEKKGEEGFEKAADTSTCVADAKPFTGTKPAGYPADFPLPQGAVLYAVQDRGGDGVVSTAVVKADLKAVLADLNGPAQQAGFKITSGETEDHDAEANWEGGGYRGRWAIRDSASCEGEVVIQLLSKKQ